MGKELEERVRIEQAYLSLLMLPDGGVRESLQGVLCELRDKISKIRQVDPEEVQNHFELEALRERQLEMQDACETAEREAGWPTFPPSDGEE